jgi:hypothetical protein
VAKPALSFRDGSTITVNVLRTTQRAATVVAGALLVLGTGGNAFAAAGGTTGAANLQCFSGTTDNSGFLGTCTTTGTNRSGAVLANNSDDSDGDYSGVYLNKKDINGKSLSKVSALGYTYSGPETFGAGDLSLNVGIDSTGDGLTDGYAFVDAVYCAGTGGTVDVVHDGTCGIWFLGTEYANWAALVTAFPTATVGKDGQAFIVAERTPSETTPAIWTISKVVLS